MRNKFYDINKLLKYNTNLYVIIGKRDYGKSKGGCMDNRLVDLHIEFKSPFRNSLIFRAVKVADVGAYISAINLLYNRHNEIAQIIVD